MQKGIKIKTIINFIVVILLFNIVGVHTCSALDDSGIKEAKKIYSVLHYAGFSDNWIAGILSNWTHESGSGTGPTPEAFEGYYTLCESCGGSHKRHTICKDVESMASVDGMHDFAVNKLFPMYERSGVSFDKSGYLSSDGKYTVGIGYGQLTGVRSRAVIDWCTSRKLNWYDTKSQLAYILVENTGNFKGYARGEGKDIGAYDACIWFSHNWEGGSYADTEHASALSEWVDKISKEKWSSNIDESFAKDVLALVKLKDGEDGSKYADTEFNPTDDGSKKDKDDNDKNDKDSKNTKSEQQISEWDLVGMPTKSEFGKNQALPTMANTDDWSEIDIYNVSKIGESIENDKSVAIFNTVRTIVVFIGLMLVIYSILMLVALMFDKLNSIFEFSLLSVITFGVAKYTNDKELVGRDGYVQSKKVVAFILVILFVGLLFISGGVFPLIFKGIQYVYSLFNAS